MMKMIFLVDGDNNIGTGLQGIDLLTAEDTVLVFFGKGQTLANVKKLCAGTKAQVQYLESVKGGKNSLDFQIITELGVLVGRGEADFAYVISQDKGYEAAMSALHARYASTFREVALRPSIQDCLQAAFLLRAGTREELAAAHKEAEERKLEISLLEEELEKAKQRLADTEAQLKESEEKLAKAGPAAAAYEKVKNRTAGIELEAHCRAQAVQAEAEERIRKTRAEVEQWLNRVQGNYGRLRADMDAAVSRACGELDQVRQTLEQISGELARQDEGLDKLTKSCCAELTHRAPDPLPLDEK